MKQETKQLIHVRFDEPIDLRKKILNTAIGSANLLKDYQKIKNLRDKKENKMLLLKKEFSKIKAQFTKFKNLIPEIEEKEETKEILEEKQKKMPLEEPEFETSEISKLKKELSELDSKIKEINI